MHLLNKLNNYVEKFENFLVIFILTAMVLLSFTQVLLRNFADSGIDWADIFLRQMVLWVGLIGASLSTKNGKGIAIDVASKFLPNKIKMLVNALTNLFSVYVCYLLFRSAFAFVKDEKEFGSILFEQFSLGFVTFNEVHTWIFTIILPFAFAVISTRFLLLAIQNLITLFSQKELK